MRSFRGATDPELVNYLDLLPKCGATERDALPDGVAESRERPLLYFITGNRLSADEDEKRIKLNRLRRTLGSRGERAFLAMIETGLIRVIPVSLDSWTDQWREFRRDAPGVQTPVRPHVAG